jgi:hypothetical protein
LVVKVRKDGPNPLLMSLYEQGRQLDNLQVRLFDKNYEATADAKAKAGKLMQGIAEAIIEGKVEKKTSSSTAEQSASRKPSHGEWGA